MKYYLKTTVLTAVLLISSQITHLFANGVSAESYQSSESEKQLLPLYKTIVKRNGPELKIKSGNKVLQIYKDEVDYGTGDEEGDHGNFLVHYFVDIQDKTKTVLIEIRQSDYSFSRNPIFYHLVNYKTGNVTAVTSRPIWSPSGLSFAVASLKNMYTEGGPYEDIIQVWKYHEGAFIKVAQARSGVGSNEAKWITDEIVEFKTVERDDKNNEKHGILRCAGVSNKMECKESSRISEEERKVINSVKPLNSSAHFSLNGDGLIVTIKEPDGQIRASYPLFSEKPWNQKKLHIVEYLTRILWCKRVIDFVQLGRQTSQSYRESNGNMDVFSNKMLPLFQQAISDNKQTLKSLKEWTVPDEMLESRNRFIGQYQDAVFLMESFTDFVKTDDFNTLVNRLRRRFNSINPNTIKIYETILKENNIRKHMDLLNELEKDYLSFMRDKTQYVYSVAKDYGITTEP